MIFFDLDGTLMDHDHAERRAALRFWEARRRLIDEPAQAFADRWQAAARRHHRRYQAGEVDFQGQRRARIREVLRDPQIEDRVADALFAEYCADYERHWRLFDDVPACLRRLRGFRLGIITNGDPGQQRLKLQRLGIAKAFAVVASSGEMGTRKPQAAIFHAACALAGDAPERCAHVGDDLRADAQGASRAGLVGVWLKRKPGMEGEHPRVIRDLHQFAFENF
jgi:putative hydrolase of the HAD superfamily